MNSENNDNSGFIHPEFETDGAIQIDEKGKFYHSYLKHLQKHSDPNDEYFVHNYQEYLELGLLIYHRATKQIDIFDAAIVVIKSILKSDQWSYERRVQEIKKIINAMNSQLREIYPDDFQDDFQE